MDGIENRKVGSRRQTRKEKSNEDDTRGIRPGISILYCILDNMASWIRKSNPTIDPWPQLLLGNVVSCHLHSNAGPVEFYRIRRSSGKKMGANRTGTAEKGKTTKNEDKGAS